MEEEYDHIKSSFPDKSRQDEDNAQALEKLELMARILTPELTKKIDELKEENAILKIKSNKYDILKSKYAEQAIELDECKRNLMKAQELIRVAEKCKESGDATPSYDFVYDLGDFDPDFSSNDIDTFFNNLFLLANKKAKYGEYLIKNSMAVVPIYIIYKQDASITNTKWAYRSDLKSFCEYWNINVADRMEDPERREALRCNYKTIKAELNKSPWKNVGPVSWRKLADGNARHKAKLNNAATIRAEVLSQYA